MTVIHVPRPPQSAMNPDRPANALLLSQVSHLQHAERRLVHSRSDGGNSPSPCRRCKAASRTLAQARTGNCCCRRPTCSEIHKRRCGKTQTWQGPPPGLAGKKRRVLRP